MHQQRKWYLEMESAAEPAVNIVETTTEDSKYYRNLVDKAASLRVLNLETNLERNSTLGKMLHTETCCREILCKRINQCSQPQCLF